MPNKHSFLTITTTIGNNSDKFRSDFDTPLTITYAPRPEENEKYDLRELIYHSQDLAELGLYDKAIEIAESIADKDSREYTLCTIASTLLEVNNIERASVILESVSTDINNYESFLSKVRTLIELADKCVELNVLTNLNGILSSVELLIGEFNDEDIHKTKFLNELAYLYMHIGNKEKAMILWNIYLSMISDRIKKHESYYDEVDEFAGTIIQIAMLGEYEKAKLFVCYIPYNNLRESVDKILNDVK
jgi:tetratricopeptide (TPR) repeat protein